MAGTKRLKRTAMFVPIEGGFQRKSDQSLEGESMSDKGSMSCGAENRAEALRRDTEFEADPSLGMSSEELDQRIESRRS
jgi:hypothetical protein